MRIQVIPFDFRYERFISFKENELEWYKKIGSYADTIITEKGEIDKIRTLILSPNNILSGYPYDDYRAAITFINKEERQTFLIGLDAINVNGYYRVPPLELLHYIDKIIYYRIYKQKGDYIETFPLAQYNQKLLKKSSGKTNASKSVPFTK